jgi:hypothetical protein
MKHYVMKMYEEWRYSATNLDLDTRWSEWSPSRPGRFTPREGVSRIHWIGGWMGSIAGLDPVD